jgi:hypothetical protein
MVAMLMEILIGVGYGIMAGVPMMLAFSWATHALGAVPQPYPVPVRRPGMWTPQPAAVRLPRAS